MKKLLLSLGLILAITLSANAQRHHRTVRHRVTHEYTTTSHQAPRRHAPERYSDNLGELRMHVAGELGITDIGGIFMHEYPYHFSIGAMAEAQVGRALSLGLGAEYYGTRSIYPNQADKPYLSSVPIYANARLSTLGWGAKFFVEARAGYAIPVGSVNVGGTNYAAKGFFTGAGIGFSCFGSNISIGVNALDVNNGYSQSHYHTSSDIVTDVYLRYSFAIPVN
ncbi:MAG: hypothetical protein IKM95_01310 [Bacteroidales bacterium]|jgi:hypothetical protein|nr:hypothetical protein [Bacteroidales bacterium]